MSYSLTPSKRPRNLSSQDSYGQGKFPKIQPQHFKLHSATTTLRLLCPLTKIGVIGKAGNVISKIRQDTGAKVKVEDLVPGCDERVIVISASDKETQVTINQSDVQGKKPNTTEQEDASTEHCEVDKDKQPDTEPEKETPSMLKALLLIFERMADGDKETDKGDKDSDEASALVARLLVPASQVGPLLGEDGNAIKHMSSETRAQIHVLPRDKVPPCVSAPDELLQITGGLDAVVKALQFVCQQLLGIPPKDHESFSPNSKEPPSVSSGNSLCTAEVFESPKHSLHSQGSPRADADYTSDQPMRDPKYHESGRMDLTFRLLCHEDNVGGVIGKEGAIVKTLQQETGCEIKILDRINDSEDRIIVISSPAHPEDRISAPQEAVLRVQTRIDRSVPDIMDKRSTSKIIIPTNQIECLLDKDGSIIAEMKKSSGAFIEIVEKDQIPKSASENEEVIQKKQGRGMDVAAPVDGDQAPPKLLEDIKPPLVELNITDSTELWLIQWPIGQLEVSDFDGQEVTLKVDHDGQLSSFEGASGKSYDIVSYACQEPDATVFSSFASDFTAVGKISRRVSLVHYPEPEELAKTGPSGANKLYLKSGTSTTQSSRRTTTVTQCSNQRKSRLLGTPDTSSRKNSRSSCGPAVSTATLGSPKSSRKRTRESMVSQDQHRYSSLV